VESSHRVRDVPTGRREGVATADEKRVRAVVTAPATVVSLKLDPRSLRQPPEELAGHFRAAINEAFDDLRRALTEISGAPVIDPLAIARELRSVSEDLDRRMGGVTGAIQESVTALRQDAVVPGEVPTMEFGDMFGQLADLLETIGGVADGEPPVGEGTVSGGWVRVRCEPGPRIASIVIERRAMRGADELAALVLAAANAGFTDLLAKSAELRREAGADPDAINARIEELRERGITRMLEYGQAVSTLMGGIRPRQ
jgi:DNA-binding protein YbaB